MSNCGTLWLDRSASPPPSPCSLEVCGVCFGSGSVCAEPALFDAAPSLRGGTGVSLHAVLNCICVLSLPRRSRARRAPGGRLPAPLPLLREDPITKVDNILGAKFGQSGPFSWRGGGALLLPLKDSARRMRVESPEHMLGPSKMAPRLRPCDSGSPRNRLPRPGSGLQLTIGASARGSQLLRAETRSSHSCG